LLFPLQLAFVQPRLATFKFLWNFFGRLAKRDLTKHPLSIASVSAAALLLAVLPVVLRNREPVYAGQTLTRWLAVDNPQFVWMPNDVYGHIHNELWDAVVAGGYSVQRQQTKLRYDSGTILPSPKALQAVRAMGPKALPCLINLMSSQPFWGEQFWNWRGPYLPNWGARLFLSPRPGHCHYMALLGFSALGTNAQPALPALVKLLNQPSADFELGCAISAIGPEGRKALVNALTNSAGQTLHVAAFCLGEDPEARDAAVPALLSAIESGREDYQVFGALGRLQGDSSRVVPVLTRYLQRPDVAGTSGFNVEMAILILGLYREKAEPALPVLVSLYAKADPTAGKVIRLAVENIRPDRFQELLGTPWTAADDQEPW
jgi:hypothetical protein